MMDRKKLEAEARKLRGEWGNKTGIDVDKYIAALADWAERIQQEAVAKEHRAFRKIVLDSLGGFAVVHPAAAGALDAIYSALDARSKP